MSERSIVCFVWTGDLSFILWTDKIQYEGQLLDYADTDGPQWVPAEY